MGNIRMGRVRRFFESVLSRIVSNDRAYRLTSIGVSTDLEQYDVSASPFDILWVNPSEIIRVTAREWKPWSNRRQLIGSVKPGNWDQRKPERPGDKTREAIFEDTVHHQSSVEHFVNGVPWQQTPEYDNIVSFEGSEQVANERFQAYDELYERIKQQGYQTQEQLGAHPHDRRKRYVEEICIDIGRDGEYLFVDGRHRLSIAKILGLEQVPVAVLVRHEEWVKQLESTQ